MPKVVIAGGGIGGLSVAHELSKHPGFDVHVYEKASRYGGKAASQNAQVGATYAPGLGEHGFRFFPWFYRHLAETLAEIPLPGGASVFDALAQAAEAGVARNGTIHRFPRTTGVVDFLTILQTTFQGFGFSAADVARYGGYLLKFHTSCHERRAHVYEHEVWADFAGITRNEYQPDFAKYLDSLPMILVAMRASEGSARTLGNVGQQMMVDFDPVSYNKIDAVLQGPTSRVWIEPWVAMLKAQGVAFHEGYELSKIVLDTAQGATRQVEKLVFHHGGADVTVDIAGGYCVCALPIEAMDSILTQELIDADAALGTLKALTAQKPWRDMIGVQYFLDTDLPMAKGHVAYPDTDWALTSVSQPQFWQAGAFLNPDLSSEFGVSNLGGIISVIASNWTQPVTDPSSPVSGKSARECDRDEIKQEIWRQLAKAAFAGALQAPFSAHMDSEVTTVESGTFYNPTPLLIHPPGSYEMRPAAALTGIENLLLAADYVRTNTELATMEGANEAGKRAARKILVAEGVPTVNLPGIYPLDEGTWFDTARELDCWLFDSGAGHVLDVAIGSAPLPITSAGGYESFVPITRRRASNPRHKMRAIDVLRDPGTEPLRAIPHQRLVYHPFPRTPPRGLSENAANLYRAFLARRAELAQFGTEPSERGYRAWSDLLLAGARLPS